MTCLGLPRGKVTTNLSEMRNYTADFYTDLFVAEQCSMECCEELLERLPQLTPEEQASMDCELTLEALMVAVNQLVLRRSTGILGLSCDIFWNTIEPDLHGVLLECLKTESLQVSCHGQCFPCPPKKETWPYLNTGSQCPPLYRL